LLSPHDCFHAVHFTFVMPIICYLFRQNFNGDHLLVIVHNMEIIISLSALILISMLPYLKG